MVTYAQGSARALERATPRQLAQQLPAATSSTPGPWSRSASSASSSRSPAAARRARSSAPRLGSAGEHRAAVETFGRQGGDPYAHLQHGSATLRLEQAHRWATGKGVKIAVVDTGVDFDHPDLRERVKKAQNFVDRGERTFTNDIHGTAVAGLIAATANNDIGIAGVAPQAEIYALKACWEQPPGVRQAVCNSYTLAKAVDFAIVAAGAQVLNFSLAGPDDPLLGKLIDRALAQGDRGGGGRRRHAAQDFPASHKGVIGVLGSDDLKAAPPPCRPGTPRATLAAPGVDILTTMPHGSYDLFSGSSAAAAEVSGDRRPPAREEPQAHPRPARDDPPQDRPPHRRRPGRARWTPAPPWRAWPAASAGSAAALPGLITPALFSHRPPPDREKREGDRPGRAGFDQPGVSTPGGGREPVPQL